jgi:hypothetical protein
LNAFFLLAPENWDSLEGEVEPEEEVVPIMSS